MARNGSGTYSLTAGNPVVNGTTISSTVHNNTMTDLASEMTNSTDKDGQTVITGDWNFNNQSVTAATLEATGDTAAGDNAAMGYTATEGLVLTGQGSTNDVTIKNDADVEVFGVPTGTTVPVFTSTGNFPTMNSTATSPRLTLNSSNASGQPGIDLDDGGTTRATIRLNGSDQLVFEVLSQANALVIETDGDVTLSDNLIIGTSGKGIDFSATSDASGMTSELLDDYEEGTWVPTAVFSAGSGTITYNASETTGQYTKVGNVVTFNYRLITTSIASRTGTMQIGGFPFTGGSIASSCNVNFAGGLAITAGHVVSAIMTVSAATADLYLWDATTGTTTLAHTEWTDDGDIIGGGHYYV
ncbi:hypothetical protein OAA60_00725 [Porticoccaceae bacterium]|nr:hypothetical protein [Porticoccaceae bacterium]